MSQLSNWRSGELPLQRVVAAFIIGAITSLPVFSRADEIDTEHLFGFTIGTDIGQAGEKEIEGSSDGRFGKRGGSYAGLSQVLEAEFTLVRDFRLSIGAAAAYHDISGVPGLVDRRQTEFQGVSIEMRYRLLDRERAGIGLAIDVTPHWSRLDEASGEPVAQYGAALTVAIDKELVPNRVVAAFNAFYEPEATRSRVTGAWSRDATVGVKTALMWRLHADVFVGGEARYLRRYEGLGLDTFAGHALFLGPTVFAKLSPHSWIVAAWSVQAAGRSADDPASLDLSNFERHQATIKFGVNF
jgi:hypothetical protein